MDAYRLGIDYGTSNTVAMLRRSDGRTRPLLFDSSPLLPSGVFATADGRLLVGRDAERNARMDPSRFEPNPKRCVDDGAVLLGDRPVPVVELMAATLREVALEAERVGGTPPSDVVVTCPATWGALRRGVLTEAAISAGLPRPRMVSEPVAAAAYFATGVGHRVGEGEIVVVYDLGGGTLDVSAVRRTPEGYEVVAVEGMPAFGGVDLDAVIVELLGTGVEPAEWARLNSPATPEERRRTRQFWDDARSAKEALSRQPNTSVLLPTTGRDLQVGREQFWAAAREPLAATAGLTKSVVDKAGVGLDKIAGLFLVGGSTRIPLVATVLHQETGITPTVLEQPEIVVAEGALQATVALPEETAETAAVVATPLPGDEVIVLHAPPSFAPVPARTAPPAPLPGPPGRRKKGVGDVLVGLLVLALIAGGVYWIENQKNETGDDTGGGSGTGDGGDSQVVEPEPGDGPVYGHDVDLCEVTDLKAVKGIAGSVSGTPTATGPTEKVESVEIGCMFVLRGSGLTDMMNLTVTATVYEPTEGTRTLSSDVAQPDADNGTLEGVGAAANYSHREATAGGYTTHIYILSVVDGNVILHIDLTGLSSADPTAEDFNDAVGTLAEQILDALPTA
ncbi:Hsp70 family protein [Phytomonospora sp. NPDC050363]|uniref:Hsp70 family protein n=1 Tax=Phytomonospora sp. NPDC050363 TaxID=3155642 RepID=UPI0033FA8AA5